MIPAYSFLLHLHNSLSPNQPIGNHYHFSKWMPNGSLQFRINNKQEKSIPAALLVMAYHIHVRNSRINRQILLDRNWLNSNGYTDWCFEEVINYLINHYAPL